MSVRELPTDLRRYGDGTRMLHWGVALLFFAAGLTGLAFFHPWFYPLVNLFGGGAWSRILHPYMGVGMFVLFAIIAVMLWRDNVIRARDRKWMSQATTMLKGEKERMEPAGKYNGGQKVVFWLMVLSLLVLLLSGLTFWHAWFPELPIGLRRIGVLLHAGSAVVLILSVIVHVYAAIWVKGTMRAMTRGTVTRGWAQVNHPLWAAEATPATEPKPRPRPGQRA